MSITKHIADMINFYPSPTTSSFFTYPTPILSFNWKNFLSSLLLLFIIPPLSLLLYHIFLSICTLILYFFCPFLYLSHFSWLIKCFFSMQGPACLIEATQSMDKHVIPRKTPPPLRAGEWLPLKGVDVFISKPSLSRGNREGGYQNQVDR